MTFLLCEKDMHTHKQFCYFFCIDKLNQKKILHEMLRKCQVFGQISFADAMAQFASCRKPWSDYIATVTKHDSEAYDAPLNPKPMYRGRKEGKTGWLMNERVQLHYKRFPDEKVIARLSDWHRGLTAGDLEMQQFRGAQPFILNNKDELGEEMPDKETYMKLNYKNPRVLGRFLTRTGHFYPRDILPMNGEAFQKLRFGVRRAQTIGLWPKYGNPFWFRSLKERPQPHKAAYDPLRAQTKQSVEQFSAHWLQTNKIKLYFATLEQQKQSSGARIFQGNAEQKTMAGYESELGILSRLPGTLTQGMADTPLSEKITTLPGPTSLQGLQKNKRLYQQTSLLRYGNKDKRPTSSKL